MIEDDDTIFSPDPFDPEARKLPPSPAGMLSRFKRAARRVDLTGVTPHFIRHSSLTALGNVLPIVDVAAIAGHSNIRTTSRYMHSTDENRRRGIEALDDVLSAPEPEQTENVVRLRDADK